MFINLNRFKTSRLAKAISSLFLDFTATNTLDDRVTFSRTSNATVTRSDGTIGYAPHNLLTFSEQFDNTAWTKTEITVSANNTTAPNGTVTADRIIESTTASATHVLFQSAGSANVHSLSFYFKPNGRSWVNIRIDGTSNYFNITTGALGTIAGGNTATIAAVGNGWYRCSIAKTMSGSGAVGLRLATADNTDVYTGDGTSGIFIWGAQLEVGASPTAYNSTTVKNLLGFTEAFDNAAWTKSNSFVQTNLLLQSEAFNVAPWAGVNTTVTANATVSPDGTADADKLVEDTATTSHYVANGFTPANATTYTGSVYLKAAERGFAFVGFSGGSMANTFVSVNLSTGVITTAFGAPVSSSSTAVGNGWYRVTISLTSTGTTASNLDIRISTDGVWANRSYTGNGTSGIFAWGAQVEVGAFATSYIPTAASQVTRAADIAVMQGSNFSSWYNQNEGTMYADYSKGNITASGRVVTISNGTNNNQIRFSVVGRPDWQIVNGGSVEANVLGIDTSVNAVVKIAGVYKNNDVQASVNGTLRTEDTTATIPAVSIMHLGTNESLAGALNGTIKSISYYPTRLSNATLQTITT